MGLLDFFKPRRTGRRPQQPERDTLPYASMALLGQPTRTGQPLYKPVPRNLRAFARTPIARRAINTIKNPISQLDWDVVPVNGVKPNSETRRQCAVVKACLDSPNTDDSFRTLLEQVVEDVLCGAGAVEMQVTGNPDRPLWMWAADGLTINVFPNWSGQATEARYAQSVNAGGPFSAGQSVLLRNDELIYIRPNICSATPFGLGPLEVAFLDIERLLGVGAFAGNVASNARPSIMLDLGESTDESMIAKFRAYWRNQVEGQGEMPITGMTSIGADGKTRGPSAIRLYPEGDAATFLQYQEMLCRRVAAAFDISPQNLGLEADVNRNTAEVAEDRDMRHAIKPCADLIAEHVNREAIHGRLGFSQIELQWKGMEREDELASAQVDKLRYETNSVTPNEMRQRRGEPPAQGQWGDMFFADAEIAKQAARNVGVVDDPALHSNGQTAAPKTPANPKPAQPPERTKG